MRITKTFKHLNLLIPPIDAKVVELEFSSDTPIDEPESQIDAKTDEPGSSIDIPNDEITPPSDAKEDEQIISTADISTAYESDLSLPVDTSAEEPNPSDTKADEIKFQSDIKADEPEPNCVSENDLPTQCLSPQSVAAYQYFSFFVSYILYYTCQESFRRLNIKNLDVTSESYFRSLQPCDLLLNNKYTFFHSPIIQNPIQNVIVQNDKVEEDKKEKERLRNVKQERTKQYQLRDPQKEKPRDGYKREVKGRGRDHYSFLAKK